MASTDARPVPRRAAAYRVTFPLMNNTGSLVTGAAGLDSEISKDGGTFADCTNEATEIATSSGIYYLDLTSTEMTADTVAIIVKTTTTDAKTTTIVMYPEEIGDYRADVQQWLGTTVATPGTAGTPSVDITRIANAAVSASTAQLGVNVVNFGGPAVTLAAGRPEVNTTHAAGTAWGSGAITAASIATDAIGAAELAADAVTEIANGVWALDATGQHAQGSVALTGGGSRSGSMP